MNEKETNGKEMSSNAFNKAMLQARLDGNAMKILLAYLDVGGWKKGTPVFLSRKGYQAYGLSRATVTRHRGDLIAWGWIVPAGMTSEAGYDYYYIKVGSPAVKPSKKVPAKQPQRGDSYRVGGRLKLMQGVVQVEAAPASCCFTEVTKEVTKEVTNEVTDTSARRASEAESAGASSSLPTSKDKNDKEDQETAGAPRPAPASPIGENPPLPAGLPLREEVPDESLPQIESPPDEALARFLADRDELMPWAKKAEVQYDADGELVW